MPDIELLTVAELAAAWKRSASFVRWLIRQGKLPAVHLAGMPSRPASAKGRRDYRIRAVDAEAYLDAMTRRAQPAIVVNRIVVPKAKAKPSGPVAYAGVWDGVSRLGRKRRG